MDDRTTPTLVRRHRGVGDRWSAVTAVLTGMALAAVVLLVLLALRDA
jgi:hypothetical protein